MTDTIARLRSGKLIFETMVNLENSMRLKKGEKIAINDVMRDVAIYLDQKKGMKAGKAELENVFGTTQLPLIVEQIVKKGQIEVTQEFRDEALETRKKQLIDFLIKNAIDARTNRCFTPDILNNAIREAGIKVDNKPVENQINSIIEKLKKIIPIKIETKKIKIKIPAVHTGRAYGLLQDYREKEDWLSNGDLEVVLNLPIGLQLDFYDKLNAVTHGSAITQEVK